MVCNCEYIYSIYASTDIMMSHWIAFILTLFSACAFIHEGYKQNSHDKHEETLIQVIILMLHAHAKDWACIAQRCLYLNYCKLLRYRGYRGGRMRASNAFTRVHLINFYLYSNNTITSDNICKSHSITNSCDQIM